MVLVVLFGYSYTKRFTSFSHVILGLALGLYLIWCNFGTVQFSELFSTHPPAEDRVARLRSGEWANAI